MVKSGMKKKSEEIRRDIKSGFDDDAIMTKHGISQEELKAVYRQIVEDRYRIREEGPTAPAGTGAPTTGPERGIVPKLDQKALLFGKFGALGGAVGSVISEVFNSPARSFIDVIINITAFMGLIGACLAVSLFVAQDYYQRKPRFMAQWYRGILPGLIAGVPSGLIAQLLYAFIGPTELLRIICWSIAGALLALFMAKKIPNLDIKKAAVGGAVGGAAGGLVFIIVAVMASEVLARMLGGAAIGFCIGVMIVVTETYTRSRYLEVLWSDGRLTTLSLGARPITVGSSAACDVVHPSLPEVMAKLWCDGDEVKYEDHSSRQVIELAEGEKVDLGDISISQRRGQALRAWR
ncbi:MAG: FHA domain-containing protein [Pseudomonadota bacterium]